jgi:two-component sensor histidine kinase
MDTQMSIDASPSSAARTRTEGTNGSGADRSREAALASALADREAQLKELRHRTGSILRLLASLFDLEFCHAPDPHTRRVIVGAKARILSVSAIYDLMNRSENTGDIELGAYVTRLANTILMSHSPAPLNVRLALRLDKARIDGRRAMTLGLILTELMTNSLKYAFPGGRDGEISISLDSSGGRTILRMRDDGIGFREELRDEGAGLKIVRSLAEQLPCRFELGDGPGTDATVEMETEPSASRPR